MDIIVSIYDKLNSSTKVKVAFIAVGLLLPSVVYLTILYPDLFYNSNLIKTVIMGTTINITIIFVLTFFSLLSKVIIGSLYDKYLNECAKSIQDNKSVILKIIMSNKNNKTITLSAISEAKTEPINLTKNNNEDIDTRISMYVKNLEDNSKLVTQHYKALVNILTDISIVSIEYFYMIILIVIFRLTSGQVVELNAINIIRDIQFYIIAFMGINSIMNCIEIQNRIKEIKVAFNKEDTKMALDILENYNSEGSL